MAAQRAPVEGSGDGQGGRRQRHIQTENPMANRMRPMTSREILVTENNLVEMRRNQQGRHGDAGDAGQTLTPYGTLQRR